MKVIDLLNKIANGEEVPKYIKYYNRLHQKEDTMMCCYNNIIYKLDNNIIDLLDEVEIIEEDKKIEHIENYVDFVNLNDSEKFDYLYKMETRIIDCINKEDK